MTFWDENEFTKFVINTLFGGFKKKKFTASSS